MARPSEYSPEVAAIIVHEVEVGRSFANACRTAGIHPATGHRWQKAFSEFRDGLTRARGDRLFRWQSLMEEAATSDPKNWKAAHELILMFYPRLNPRVHQRVQEATDALMLRLKEQASAEAYEEVRRVISGLEAQSPNTGTPGPKLRAV